MKYIYFFLFLFNTLFFYPLFAQEFKQKVYNLDSLSVVERNDDETLKKLTPNEYHSHPDFGILSYNAPCKDCYELLQYRTDTTRYYVDKQDLTLVHLQTFMTRSSYDDNGFLLAYNPYLSETSPGIYTASRQDTPIEVNLLEKNTKIHFKDGSSFAFNNNLKLLHVSEEGVVTNLGTADWTNYTIGSEGARIINAWPEIDIKLVVELDKVKTTYIVKSPLGLSAGNLVFEDNYSLPANSSVTHEEGPVDERTQKTVGSISISNQEEEIIKIGRAYGFDNSEIKENSTWFGYEVSESLFQLYVPTEWLNMESLVYPLSIDPLVNSTSTFTAGWKSFRFNGEYCGGPNGACAYNLNAVRPPNTTLVGATFGVQYLSEGGYCAFACWMSEGGFSITGPCGIDQYYGCTANAPGTCTGAGIGIAPIAVPCSAPACSGNLTFTIRNSYCYCNVGGNCGVNCQWMPNNTWSVTLSGNTLETLGNTTTGNGFQTIYSANCIGTSTLNPAGANGVPGYAYSWSTGATTPTINVSNSTSGQTYTVTVTDACGVSRVATFDIACPLAVTLTDFSAENMPDNVLLEWQTATERDNDYFIVQRSADGKTFENLGTIKGVGNSNSTVHYDYLDSNPLNKLSYYRLEIVDINGNKDYSSAVSVVRSLDIDLIQLIPNPAKESVEVVFDYPITGEYEIELTTMRGQKLFKQTVNMQKGIQHFYLPLTDYSSGVYFVQIKTKNQVVSTKLVIE